MFVTFVKVLLETQWPAVAVRSPAACVNMRSSHILSPLFVQGFKKKVKLFGNILPCRAVMEISHVELSYATMFDAVSLVEHMPHCVLGTLFVWRPFTELRLWP